MLLGISFLPLLKFAHFQFSGHTSALYDFLNISDSSSRHIHSVCCKKILTHILNDEHLNIYCKKNFFIIVLNHIARTAIFCSSIIYPKIIWTMV